MALTRRQFLRRSSALAAGMFGLRTLLADLAWGQQPDEPLSFGYGPLIPDGRGILDLPEGLAYRILSRTGGTMTDGLLVPGNHDGMAAFPGPGGTTILVRNHELGAGSGGAFGPGNGLLNNISGHLLYDLGRRQAPALGGTTTLVYDTSHHRLESHFLSLAGTLRNCAGGVTPWNSWITCEENVQRATGTYEQDHGFCFEVPASAGLGLIPPVPLRGMGRFNHEAVAVDAATGIVYQTEDRDDGLLYRFLPDRPGQLAGEGRLQALVIRDRPSADTRNWTQGLVPPGLSLSTGWVTLEQVESPGDNLRSQGFSRGAARFARGEGMWNDGRTVYFACTNGGPLRKGQIWRYQPSPAEGQPGEASQPGSLELYLEPNDGNLVDNADNLTVAPWGDLIICEDGPGEQFVVGVTPEGKYYKVARNALNTSEFCGAVFSPDGSTLFVNIQSPGMTFAIFRQRERPERQPDSKRERQIREFSARAAKPRVQWRGLG